MAEIKLDTTIIDVSEEDYKVKTVNGRSPIVELPAAYVVNGEITTDEEAFIEFLGEEIKKVTEEYVCIFGMPPDIPGYWDIYTEVKKRFEMAGFQTLVGS